MFQTTDPIADMLTRIRNGSMARHKVVTMKSSKVKVAIAEILKQEGYIAGYEVAPGNGPQPDLKIRLRYGPDKRPRIQGLRRVSKPGLRVYARHDQIPRVRSGLGVSIVSRSKGVMTGRRAYREGLGGEVLCQVW